MNKDLNFEYIEDFVDYVVGEAEYDEDKFIVVIAKFDEAKEILKSAMLYEDINFDFLEIESPIMDDYEDEFVLSFWMNDGVLEIGCEKLKDEDSDYTNPCGDVVFLFSNCSSKIIPLCEGSELHFVDIDEECDYNEECCECCACDCCKNDVFVECSTDEDGDTHGFTASKSDDDGYYSFSYYTNDKLSDKDIYSMLKEFGF